LEESLVERIGKPVHQRFGERMGDSLAHPPAELRLQWLDE
jgi:hypothetical protein